MRQVYGVSEGMEALSTHRYFLSMHGCGRGRLKLVLILRPPLPSAWLQILIISLLAYRLVPLCARWRKEHSKRFCLWEIALGPRCASGAEETAALCLLEMMKEPFLLSPS